LARRVVIRSVVGILMAGLTLLFVLRVIQDGAGRSGVMSDSVSFQAPVPLFRDESAAPLTFTNHRGEAVSEADFHGSHLLVFFGYTHCPDICPANLAVMALAMDLLAEEGERVQPVFISFDPERDTAEVLASYVGHFHPRLVGLTGTPVEIERAAKAYGVFYEAVPAETGDAASYSMIHSSRSYLIGPDGERLVIFPHAADSEAIAAAVRSALQELRSGAGVEEGGS
jgi:protein SCO1/2